MQKLLNKSLTRTNKISSIKLSLSNLNILRTNSDIVQHKLEKSYSKIKQNSQGSMSEQSISNNVIESEDESEDEKKKNYFEEVYELGQKIGEGAHGLVRKCCDKKTGVVLAVKTMRLDDEHIHFLKKNFLAIKDLNHPNIIKYKALYFDKKKRTCFLVMEYLPFPNLLEIRINTEQELKEIAYDIADSLSYIHSKHICHRDIKPDNILYDPIQKEIKIIDFGISQKMYDRGRKKDMLTLTGTPYYRAPQMFEGGGYDERIDVWALGVTIYQLMNGFTPFESEYHSETISNIMKGEVLFDTKHQQKYSKASRNLILRLLKPKEERLKVKEIQKDPWFFSIVKKLDEFTHSANFQIKAFENLSTTKKIQLANMYYGQSLLFQKNKIQEQTFDSLKTNTSIKTHVLEKLNLDIELDIYGENDEREEIQTKSWKSMV